MVYIYALHDPVTEEVCYVGKTKNTINARLKTHLREAQKYLIKTATRPSYKKIQWLVSLLEKGLKPTISVLEEVDDAVWEERECYWISYYPNLTNTAKGGICGPDVTGIIRSTTTKDKISSAVKKSMQVPLVKERHLKAVQDYHATRHMKDSTKELLSKAANQRAEVKLTRSLAMQKYNDTHTISDKTRQKMSDARKKYYEERRMKNVNTGTTDTDPKQ